MLQTSHAISRWLAGATASQRCFRRFLSSASSSLPTLSSELHPEIRRGQYAKVTQDDISVFKDIIGNDGVLTDPDELQGYNIDWMRICRGQGQVALRPSTSEQVCSVLRHCNERKLAVTPQGGNTGLVGGSVPMFDEIIISTARMNNIIDIDSTAGTVVAESGCVLQQLDAAVGEHGLLIPLDLGAKGSCHIGGNVATNAGGLRLLRYGSLRGSVLGIEAALPNGQLLDCLSTLRKDNTGYDLKQLFIGSEGTLGIITKVAIACPQRPSSKQLAMLACDSFDAVLGTFRLARSQLSEIMSAFEFLDQESMNVVQQNLGLSSPLPDHPFYVVTETSGSCEEHDKAKLEKFLETAMSDGCVQDGTVAQDGHQVYQLWQLRERIVEGLLVDGYEYKYDVSLRQHELYDIVEHMRQRMGNSVIRTCGYGHLGDGNLHLNFTTKNYDPKVFASIEPHVFEVVREMRGSVSAEHGLGLKKANYINFTKSDAAVQLMTSIKHLIDPNAIMNPYKVLPNH